MIGIYKITNLTNNKVYIGSSVNINNRIHYHKKHLRDNDHVNNYLQNSYNKNKDSFTFKMLEECDRENLIHREEFYINLYKSNIRLYGYNIESFENGRRVRAQEVLDRQSKAMLARYKNGLVPGMTGKTHTEETRKRFSLLARGRKHDLESKRKMSEWQTKNSKRFHKKIDQYTMDNEFIAVWEYITAASLSLNISKNSISNCLKGTTKHAGGYIWKYHPSSTNPVDYFYEQFKELNKEKS